MSQNSITLNEDYHPGVPLIPEDELDDQITEEFCVNHTQQVPMKVSTWFWFLKLFCQKIENHSKI